MAADVDLILPVYNAADDLRACLVSISQHSSLLNRLIVIDDGSTSPEVEELLHRAGDIVPGAIVHRMPNRGFVQAVNAGLAMSAAPYVVILNSDTIVTRRWLEKLVAAAHARPNVATVTPLTNNGTICSVPEIDRPNEIPAGYDVASFAALVERLSFGLFPEAPTGVGFCMLVTRNAIDAVGSFDADAFGRGYGEENDFCQRAIGQGFVNLIADDTFVYHRGGASFGGDRHARIQKNLLTLTERYPNYNKNVATFIATDPLSDFRDDLRAHLNAAPVVPPAMRRVLHLLHQGGGTEINARNLAETSDPGVLSYVSTSDGRRLAVDEYHRGTRRRSWEFPIERPLRIRGPLRDSTYRDALATVCQTLQIDLIHIHHLIHNTLDIADVASSLGIPYVMTLHDYYTLCPTYTLLDPDAQPCGACIGRRPPETAARCMTQYGLPPEHAPVHLREMSAFLAGASRLFVPNPRVRDIFAEQLPELLDRIEVIEHGHRAMSETPFDSGLGTTAPARLNVALIGGLERHKGLDAFRALLRVNRRTDVVFHLYGWTPDADLRSAATPTRSDGSQFVYHGPYEARRIASLLHQDRIHLGLHMAVWEETFSYTLSEFAESGIPVVAGAFGAQGERVERCRLGWTVPSPHDSRAILAIIDDVIQTPRRLIDCAAGIRKDLAMPDIESMWRRYESVYRDLTANRGPMSNESREVPLNRAYVSFLARTVSTEDRRHLQTELAKARAEIDSLRERLRSPRHRVADAGAAFLHRIPIVWPIVAKVTDAIVKQQKNRRGG